MRWFWAAILLLPLVFGLEISIPKQAEKRLTFLHYLSKVRGFVNMTA